jgi:sugar O-acyltransferase (sialic acid O-acetyltransferase NeuD family)
MKRIVIFGCGPLAELAYYYLTEDTSEKIAGFTVDKEFNRFNNFMNLPLVNFESVEDSFSPLNHKIFIPISYRSNNKIRRIKYNEAKNKGYDFYSYVSSKATIFNTKIGENCFILENNTIQPYSSIGDNVTLWSGNHIGHHSIINDHAFISSQVVISGSVIIGEQTFIGVNATVHDNISIGKECLIGAGSNISKNINDYSIVKSPKFELSKIKTDINKIL